MTESNATTLVPRLNLVAWEVTKRCNLTCAHCRASAEDVAYEGELTLVECKRVIDEIKTIGNPILILSGGEPLARPDVFEIGKYASSKGLRVVMGSNGTLIDGEVASKLTTIPIGRIAISLDFPTPQLEDGFRGRTGAFDMAMAGIENARKAGVEIQINCTITKMNFHLLGELVDLALKVGAVAFHPFLLVPTGRGKGLEAVELSPDEYEQALNKIYDMQVELGDRLFFKPTDAPHYMRVVSQRQRKGAGQTESGPVSSPSHPSPRSAGHPGGSPNGMTRGCLAGVGFCFVSHTGKVQGCGYLTVEAGDLKRQSFGEVWRDSPVFKDLRNLDNIKGKCGVCEYKRVCGGCRARAFETTGDYLNAEPYCSYQPSGRIAHATS
jgi:heme b synthase